MQKIYLLLVLFYSANSYSMVNLATGHFYYKTNVVDIKDVKLDLWKAYNSGQKKIYRTIWVQVV